MSIEDARIHLEAARQALVMEAYRVEDSRLDPIDHITISHDLKRIDFALGPKGESMFARIADVIDEAYTEICAALESLERMKP